MLLRVYSFRNAAWAHSALVRWRLVAERARVDDKLEVGLLGRSSVIQTVAASRHVSARVSGLGFSFVLCCGSVAVLVR